MRVATWNLRRPGSPASERGQALRHCMRQIDADIWVLTETRDAMSPGDGYVGTATSGSDRKQSPGEQWTMIWSRLPVLSQEPTADPIRTVCVRVATTHSGPLLVYGTVLPWRTDSRWLPLRGGGAFQQALQGQEEDWRRLRQKYPQDGLCIAGDFNQDLGSRSYAGTALGQTSLRRAFGALSLDCLTGDDVDPVAKQTADVRRNIDHICLDARFNTPSSVRRGAWPGAASELKGLSDHFGVWVDIDGLI
jgi:hypothetical protein